MNNNNKNTKTSLAIKKAYGTIKKVSEMIEEDRYCIDIIQQIDGAIGLLKSAKQTILKDHLNHCLLQKIKEDKEQTINELIKIYNIGN